ncbi:cupin domain-containing protein [Streptomyces sp. NPDC003077]|uniref:cupin domain-containing protein n=1 Tax=Streptomyces sp. NPDC003077 TaxID=3154443 RepID=UPI0033A765E9
MIGHTDNSIDIDAPFTYVWERTNDLPHWPELFSEYASIEILEEGTGSATFRLTMHPDEQGRAWSWVSERHWDKAARVVRARRVETGPFEFMNITWTYEELGPDSTRMRWVQDFRMRPDAPLDTAAMTDRINHNTAIQMQLVKERVEQGRCRVVGWDDVPPSTRRGGDLRTLLAPSNAGTSAGFCGAVRLAPGEGVSEHYHPYSEEYLFVASGEIRVDLNGKPVRMGAEQALHIPRNVRHRLTNTGDAQALVVFQIGPLAPEPRLGHVDTESGPGDPAAAAGVVPGGGPAGTAPSDGFGFPPPSSAPRTASDAAPASAVTDGPGLQARFAVPAVPLPASITTGPGGPAVIR